MKNKNYKDAFYNRFPVTYRVAQVIDIIWFLSSPVFLYLYLTK